MDATNTPGLYSLTLTSAETSHNVVLLGGKSSTGNVVLICPPISFELLPTVAPGSTGGLPELPISVSVNIPTGVVYLSGPVSVSGTVGPIAPGEAYNATTGRPLIWTLTGFSSLATASLALYYSPGPRGLAIADSPTALAIALTVSGTSPQTITGTLTNTQSASWPAASGSYALKATFSDGSIQTLASGQLLILNA